MKLRIGMRASVWLLAAAFALSLAPGNARANEGLVVVGALVYAAVDPFAPNWEIAQASAGDDLVRVWLRRKRFASGGDGEAVQVLHRHAGELARAGSYTGYTVLEYSEGIESTLPLAQRVSQGLIRLVR